MLGIDCCERFLQIARADADAQGVANIRFVEADVELYPFEPIHDFCFSRFGTQFFGNPAAGLKAMRRALKREEPDIHNDCEVDMPGLDLAINLQRRLGAFQGSQLGGQGRKTAPSGQR